MEEQNIRQEENIVETEKEAYRPRPAYQVWAARIGLVIVIAAFLIYCYNIATGGMG